MFCPWCRLEQPRAHRFCARCGFTLPAHLLGEEIPDRRSKTFRFFAGVKVDPGDPENAYLRVSSYRRNRIFTTPEGSVTVPGHHVRFSIWVGNTAVCVLSLPETEAKDLRDYLNHEVDTLAAAPAE